MRAFHHAVGDHHLEHLEHLEHHQHHQVEHRTGRAAPWFVLAAIAFLAALVAG